MCVRFVSVYKLSSLYLTIQVPMTVIVEVWNANLGNDKFIDNVTFTISGPNILGRHQASLKHVKAR